VSRLKRIPEFAVWTDILALDSDQFVAELIHRLVAGTRLRLPRKRPQVTHGRPYRLTAAAQRLVDVLRRSRRPLGIAVLMQACGVPPERSQAVRNHLSALARHAIIRRAGHGLYAAQPITHAEEAQAGE